MEILTRRDLPKLLIEFKLPLIGIEIGVAGAANACDLLKEGLQKIYCVDAWETINVIGDGSYPKEFHENNYALANKILSELCDGTDKEFVMLKGLSSEMFEHIEDNSVGLLYIDGDHTFDGCLEDIVNYYPKVVSGGIIAFRDYPNESGVKRAVDKFVKFNDFKLHLIPETGITDAGCWFQKL